MGEVSGAGQEKCHPEEAEAHRARAIDLRKKMHRGETVVKGKKLCLGGKGVNIYILILGCFSEVGGAMCGKLAPISFV